MTTVSQSFSKISGLGGAEIVPLTTIWTAPAGCPSTVDGAPSCAPPEYSGVWVSDGYYSPGVCFSGYVIGCTANFAMNYVAVKTGETAALCVPRSVQFYLVVDEISA